ncbi:MAG: endonuclease [Chromatiales bacterium]
MAGSPRCTRSLVLAIVLSAPSSHADEPEWLRRYNHALRQLWSEVYAGGGETLYCAAPFGRDKGSAVNAEHVFPMSWAANELPCGSRRRCRLSSPRFNRMERDLHNVYPALARINRARGASAFGEVAGEERRFGNCDFEVADRRVEPRPEVRGNIARAIFYMAWRYGVPVYPRHGRLLLRWHGEDPPDAEERMRNEDIARLQGGRNPFIDNPARAAELEFRRPTR